MKAVSARILICIAVAAGGGFVLSFFGCAAPGKRAADVVSPVWPSPPEPARIAFVQNISGPEDVGVRRSPAARVWRRIIGSDREAESLLKPFGIALDEHDNLCITDTGANRVSFYDRAKRKWNVWSEVGKVRFISPVAIAKRNGTFFVADSGRNAVLAFNERPQLLFTITNRLERPAGLAVSGNRLFVADSLRHRVVVFDLNGDFVSEFGDRGAGPGEFNFPTHVAAGDNGALFVTDSMNARIQVFDSAGRFQREMGSAGDAPGHFGRPKGAALDTFGHVYVVDAVFDNVQIFDRTGQLLLNFGAAGSAPGEFWLANGIAISAANEIFVADAYNQRVQVFRYVGAQP